MRELKFRVYDGQLKYMLENPLVTFQGGRGFTVDGYPTPEARRFHVMQFTGLRDENSMEIYEGDILTWKDYYDQTRYEDVVYDTEYGMFRLSKSSRVLGNTIKDSRSLFGVIGNIYESPELLNPTTEREDTV